MVPDKLVFLIDEEALIRERELSKIQIIVEVYSAQPGWKKRRVDQCSFSCPPRARSRTRKRLLDSSLVKLFNAILDHAFLLPLMELKLNHCTSFQGGQILAQQNLAHPYCFSSVTPRFFGKTFIALELTEVGENEFRHAFEELPSGRHLAHFASGVVARAGSAVSCPSSHVSRSKGTPKGMSMAE